MASVTITQLRRSFAVRLRNGDCIVTVARTALEMKRWIADVLRRYRRFYNKRRRLVVGVGVQREGKTLQLCAGKMCLVVQLDRCRQFPKTMKNFLVDSDVVVGLDKKNEQRKLSGASQSLVLKSPIDIRALVPEETTDAGIAVWVDERLGEVGIGQLIMRSRKRRWTDSELNLARIREASLVAIACARIGVKAKVWRSDERD